MLINKNVLIAGVVLLLSAGTLAFPGEVRSYFKDWLVVCQKTQYSNEVGGSCRANVSVRDKTLFPYGDGTVFQLTLQRNAKSRFHIEFYHTLDDYYPSNQVSLQVDNRSAIKLMVMTKGNLAKLTADQSEALVPLIKKGRWLHVSYVSKTGKPVKTKVSLRGSTASLLFIEQFYYNRGF